MRLAFRFGLLLCTAGLACALPAGAQSCDRFLNASDGDDRVNEGLDVTTPVQSLEHAFHTFPAGSIVCMTAGAYVQSIDADGIQLVGESVQGKSMTFVLQSFGDASEVALTEDELVIDIGDGRIRFVGGTATSLHLGVGATSILDRFADHTTFLHTFSLLSGTMELDGAVLTIGPSVGNPHFVRGDRTAPPEAAIVRDQGMLIGSASFPQSEPVPRVFAYVGSGDRFSGPELPPTLERLELMHESGTVQLDDAIALTAGGSIVQSGGGTTVFGSTVNAFSAGSMTVRLDGDGTLELLGGLTVQLDRSVPDLITHSSDGALVLASVDVRGDSTHTASIVQAGAGPLAIEALESAAPLITAIHDAPGRLLLGRSGEATSIDLDVVNAADREVRVIGPATLRGLLDNDGSFVLEADAAIDGRLENSGTVDLGSSTLQLSGSADHVNSGSFAGTSSGRLELVGDLTLSGTGTLSNLRGAEGSQSVTALQIAGSVETVDGSNLTLVDTPRILGSVAAQGGSVTLPAVQIDGGLSALLGSVRLSGDVAVASDVRVDSGGRLDLGSQRLDAAGDVRIIGGTFEGSAGTLIFTGVDQLFQSSTGVTIGAIEVPASAVEVSGGPALVNERLTVGEGASMLLSGPLVVEGAALRVDGQIETGPAGELLFAGADNVIRGSAVLGNVRIILQSNDEAVTLTESSVVQEGSLTLERGRLVVGPGSTYSLRSGDGAPLIRYDLTDAGSNTGTIVANAQGFGAFSAPDTGFDLEYVGTLGADTEGSRPPITSPVRNFSLDVETPTDPPAGILLSAPLEFSGNLFVGAGTRLYLGDADLTASGRTATHVLEGQILTRGNGALVLQGGVLEGRPEAGRSEAGNITVRSDANVSIRDVRSVAGLLSLESGTTTLAPAADGVDGYQDAGNVAAIHILPGAGLQLGADVEVVDSLRASDGLLTFHDHDVVLDGGASFTASATELRQGSGTGRVVVAGRAVLGSTNAAIPRLLIDAGADAARLSDELRVGGRFEHRSGVLDLQDHDVVLHDGPWIVQGGSYAGGGTVTAIGNVDAVFDQSVHLLRAAVTGPNATLSLRSTDTTGVTLTVEERLNLLQGELHLGGVDLILTGALASRGHAGVTTDADSSYVILAGAEIELGDPLTVPHLAVRSDSRIEPRSTQLVVGSTLSFPSGSLTGVNRRTLRIGRGARIVRTGADGMDGTPVFSGDTSILYDLAGGVFADSLVTTGPEIPPSGLHDLTVDAGANRVELASPTVVGGTLLLRSGGFEPTASLTIDRGGSVHLRYAAEQEPRFISSSYRTRGPISLFYTGIAGNLDITDLSFPPRAPVGDLVVSMGDSLAGTHRRIVVMGTRLVDRLIVDHNTSESVIDLNGQTLLVTGDARIQRGVASSQREALLDVQNDLYVGDEARVEGIVSATVKGTTTVDGRFQAYRLRSLGDITVRGHLGGAGKAPDADAGVVLPGVPNVDLFGRDQTLTISNADSDRVSVDDMINRLTVQSGSAQSVSRIISAGDAAHTLAVNRLILDRGYLATGRNDIRLPSNGPGFVRMEESRSHVIGRVSRSAGSGEASRDTQLHFPVGTGGPNPLYRPLTLLFAEATAPNTVVTASHVGRRPGGYLGLPIRGGEDILIDDTAAFYWTLEASPALPEQMPFTMSVLATAFTQFGAAREARLLRKDSSDDAAWQLHGTPDRYDNATVEHEDRSALFVQTGDGQAPISSTPVRFTVGIQEEHTDFARVQFINVAAVGMEVVVGDSIETFRLDPREASSFTRLDGSEATVTLAGGSSRSRFSAGLAPGTDYLAVADRDEFGNVMLRYVSGARATPPIEQKDLVSLGFLNTTRGAPPLTLITRGDSRALFEAVPPDSITAAYAGLEPADTGFNVVSPAQGTEFIAARVDLSEARGLTVAAVAAGTLGDTGDRTPRAFFVTSEGANLPSRVQVSATEPVELPQAFVLKGNHPNPFSRTTTITFDLPETAEVTLHVFDMLGREVLATPPRSLAPSTNRHIEIDAAGLGSGAYLYRLTVTSESETRTSTGRMVVVK